MKNGFILFVIICLSISSCLLGSPIQIIQLKDNSEIRGEILEMKNGVYTIKTTSLGEIKIPAEKISAILPDKASVSEQKESIKILEGKPKSTTKTVNDNGIRASDKTAEKQNSQQESDQSQMDKSQLEKLQKDTNGRVQSMMMNGDFLQKAMALGESEEMKEVMQDPDVMRAIQDNDYETLMNNEKMKKLMESDQTESLLGETQK
ncbi:MAG: hypothetical protein HQM08_10755 [Candidatus Riflebacteria bacterium]|nr:hypothetical protein [Candidatus Riflebacteria bacterium]